MKASKKTANTTDFSDFKIKLSGYKDFIDTELDNVCKHMLAGTKEQYGEYPSKVVEAYINVLMRGGKRIRGALAIASYEMFGGKDVKMITQAAAALELFNTYILVADDIQDRSDTRRGGKAAHTQLADLHKQEHLKGDAYHFGEALAINIFLIAQHYASNIILQLDISAELKAKAMVNINNCLIVTAHGQTLDIYSEANETLDSNVLNNILEWKTAFYTFINPLQMGAILAGASQKDMASLEAYGLAAGRAFQITDDIIGTFGTPSETGKSELDDIKEGKRTLLVVNAIKNSSQADAYFLQNLLGNQQITKADFDRCKKIIIDSGSLDSAKAEANISATSAVEVIKSNTGWPKDSRKFLIDLVDYILVRKS